MEDVQMAKKKAKKSARPAKSTKTPRKAARASKAKARKKSKGPKEVRFIMVVEPGFKKKMRAATAKATKKAGKRVSMSAWVRTSLLKAM